MLKIDGIVLLPEGSPPLAGRLVVDVEETALADAPSKILHSFRRTMVKTDWMRENARFYAEFSLDIPSLETRPMQASLSARFQISKGDRLAKGDAITMDSYPIGQSYGESIRLELKHI